MPLPGERSAPTEGLKGVKPTRRRLPKLPRSPEADDLQKQSSIYMRERNQAMRLKRMREEMLLARDRGQLIERQLVEKQLDYLVVAIRQKLLTIPLAVGNHFGDREVSIREVVAYLDRRVKEALGELARLPESAQPDWLERVEEEEKD